MSTILKKQSSELFRECRIVPIMKRILYHKALLMYKSKNELALEYLSNLIVSANNKESYNTRFPSSDNFLVPQPNTELYKSSFSFSWPKVWNSLPNEIKTSKTVFELKNSYKLLNLDKLIIIFLNICIILFKICEYVIVLYILC